MQVQSVQGAIESLYPLSKLINKAIENPKKNNKALQKHFGYQTRLLQPIPITKQTEIIYFDKTNSEQVQIEEEQLLTHAYSVFLIRTLRCSELLRLNKPLGALESQKENIKADLRSDQIKQWAEIYKTIKEAIDFKYKSSSSQFVPLEILPLAEVQQVCARSHDFLLELLKEKQPIECR